MKKKQKGAGTTAGQDNFFAQLESAAEPIAQLPPAPRSDSELIVAFVAAVGVNLTPAEDATEARLRELGYAVERIRVTENVLPYLDQRACSKFTSDYERINAMMDIGTAARRIHGDDVIALGITSEISKRREKSNGSKRIAYLVHSLKHPSEVRKLREIYTRGFYLIGLHSPGESRISHLCSRPGITEELAEKLVERDRKENVHFGQQLIDTFHLADFFSGWRCGSDGKGSERWEMLLKNSLNRFIDLMFGHPNKTPTFGEYAMFLAFSAALRSADLSRQVGAVIARDAEILATGANDCPKAYGGLYWPYLDQKGLDFVDFPNGRDYMREKDSNKWKQTEIIRDVISRSRKPLREHLIEKLRDVKNEGEIAILERELLGGFYKILQSSQIKDLTEYGRVVHAEMEAIMSCARKGIPTKGATLYCTTFPCHNCAKHIIAAGIERVVFIEPYMKSKALEFHDEAVKIHYPDIVNGEDDKSGKIPFEPFWGIGPRRFFDLFSMDMSSGYPVLRKNAKGQ